VRVGTRGGHGERSSTATRDVSARGVRSAVPRGRSVRFQRFPPTWRHKLERRRSRHRALLSSVVLVGRRRGLQRERTRRDHCFAPEREPDANRVGRRFDQASILERGAPAAALLVMQCDQSGAWVASILCSAARNRRPVLVVVPGRNPVELVGAPVKSSGDLRARVFPRLPACFSASGTGSGSRFRPAAGTRESRPRAKSRSA
jgi:hypothetical protein